MILLAPHTSNWDFIYTFLSRPILRLRPSHTKFLVKSTLFKGLPGWLLRRAGGIPVDRRQPTSLTDQIAAQFEGHQRFGVTVTPEGTRKRVEQWKSGFYHIAEKARAPVLLGYIDYGRRVVGLREEPFQLSGDMEKDLADIQRFYLDKRPLYPQDYGQSGVRFPPKRYWPNRLMVGIRLALVSLLLYLLFNLPLLIYGIRQGSGQINILRKAEPVGVFLDDPSFPDSLKANIRLIGEIKQFTVDSLGLNPSGSYEKMFDQAGKPVLWVVTGSEAFSLQPKTWTFPLLGTVSYKGFFREDLAQAAADRLVEKGYDVRMGEVNAWSTLGILNDPILSNMLYRPPGSLANLIIHELTHGTLFVKSDINYNENLASFVGDEGAKLFLAHKYGAGSPEYRRYEEGKADRKKFSRFVLGAANHLEGVYASFAEAMPVAEKEAHKQRAIDHIIGQLDTVSFHNPNYYRYFSGERPNNAFFMGYRQYREKQDDFGETYQQDFGGDLKAYIQHLKETYPHVW